MSAPLKLKPRGGKPSERVYVLLNEDVRWMENGTLRTFRANTVIDDPADIASLFAQGADLRRLKEIEE